MAIIPGICGPANRPCKIAHSSSFPNQVGVYPSDLLPSTFTIWHAVFASQFPLQIRSPLLNPIGGGVLPGIDLSGGFPGLTTPIVHNWQSHHYVIFAKTSNRLNVSYTITEQDVANINALGTAEIDVGEYIFEAVSVTDEPVVFSLELTPQEKEELEENSECTTGCSAESEEDRKFRKLFETTIPNNRLLGIVVNDLGIEYRLDNGSDKSKDGLSQAGIGDLDSASYRDGSSKKIEVQLRTFLPNGEIDKSVEAGDVIYLTYVAVKEHYIRQRVNISWQTIDTGIQGECISLVLGYSVVHYRFYEWELEADPLDLPAKLSGWRAVEAFNSNINFVAAVTSNNQIRLADFPVGAPDIPGSRSYDIFPGDLTLSRLQSYMDGTSSSTITVDLNRIISQGAFHENAGVSSNNTSFRNADWFIRNQFSKFSNQKAASQHVFFNVHPKALKKRDIDKWGIERYLAQEIEKDINAGKLTFFPFMDDPTVNNPTVSSAEFLSSSNTKFDPINPVTSYGGNFEAICASLGTFPTNPSDGINSYHSFESNRINERFDKETRVLVERNFAVNADVLGPQLVTIEGIGGTSGSVSCITDPSKEFEFACHTNADNFIVYNFFSSGHTESAIRSLSFRPDIEAPSIKNNTNPHPNQFEELIGFSGMIGDIPGIQPGRAVSIASYSQTSSFIYKTTNANNLKTQFPHITAEQIEEVEVPPPGQSPLIFNVGNNYYGSLVLTYKFEEDEAEDSSAILFAYQGDTVEAIVDNIVIQKSMKGGSVSTLRLDFRWIRASVFELRGDRVKNITIESFTFIAIHPDKVNDFLEEEDSHNASFANLPISARLTDRSLFFSSDIISISEDNHSNLYIYFSDKDGGISAVCSKDYGDHWHYHYGIFEKIQDINGLDPFVVTNFSDNNAFLFFRFDGKIMCKKISYPLFEFNDSNLIERMEDLLSIGDDGTTIEGQSIYSSKGKILRRELSFIAAGDLSSDVFREISGKVSGVSLYDPYELRIINGVKKKARKTTIAIGATTAFPNIEIRSPFFSAYKKDNGELRVWYLAITDGNDTVPQLQCNFSTDDGITWYDLWEFVENSYNRLRKDSIKKTTFIDRSAPNVPPSDIEGTDPQESNQIAQFGINLHWSRLRRHKVDSINATLNSDSTILEIESPYVFYQPSTERTFFFYIYRGCLLCKMVNDSIFGDASKTSHQNNSTFSGMQRVKSIIEQQTRAHFIDGSLTDAELREELHGYPNEDTNEIMSEGNIVFKYPFAYQNFGDDRTVSAQRICALDLPTGLVRVFYKHSDSVFIKSALWSGSEWFAEDFLKDPTNIQDIIIPDTSSFTEVTGGFNGTGF